MGQMLARHHHLFHVRSLLDGPAPSDDPQARLLVQVQGVIAEYERAKIAERYRRGKLHRARAGEVFFWKVPYGYRRVGAEPDRPARMEIFEPEADIVRAIFAAHNGAPAHRGARRTKTATATARASNGS